jgi:hypothetical protein
MTAEGTGAAVAVEATLAMVPAYSSRDGKQSFVNLFICVRANKIRALINGLEGFRQMIGSFLILLTRQLVITSYSNVNLEEPLVTQLNPD